MEKRLLLFITLSVVIMMGYAGLKVALFPPPPPDKQQAAKDGDDPKEGDPQEQEGQEPKQGADDDDDDGPPANDPPDQPSDDPPGIGAGDSDDDDDDSDQDAAPPAETPKFPSRVVTLGSFAADSPYKLLVWFNSRGGTIERVEFVERERGRLRFRTLNDDRGYLSFLGGTNEPNDGGCRINVVAPGTPAALAKPTGGSAGGGLKQDDIIVDVNGTAIRNRNELRTAIDNTRAGDSITITVLRGEEDARQSLTFKTDVTHRPLPLIDPNVGNIGEPAYSYAMSLRPKQKTRGTVSDFNDLPLGRNNWELIKHDASEVAFRTVVDANTAKRMALEGRWEITRRYRLQKAGDDNSGYHVAMSLEFKNTSTKDQSLSYYLDGPNGLPIEGWWYSNKINPSWGVAGARDIIWKLSDRKQKLRSTTDIFKERKKKGVVLQSLLGGGSDDADRTFDYVGVDTQYFTAVLLPGTRQKPLSVVFQDAYAMPVGKFEESKRGRELRTLNTTYRVGTQSTNVEAGDRLTQNYVLFLGPKSTPLLAKYGLEQTIEYGWFGFISKPLSKVLHGFYALLRNYGLAIIMLTVLVRGCMFPLGRKTARNAQMMQALAPEIKKINEKYKNEMDKRAEATRELWKKYNFNPLGGCWLMLLQLPIFIGLYRCLSVDIELRQAALIPGLSWCSNLAGPDMFLFWRTDSLAFLTGETGWLGPYLNVLPIITIILFLVQQKMFTPPATDEQTRMQQKMMKYMMIFFGVLFFKVPSGLCIYFIASSLWGIGERKLIPKPNIELSAIEAKAAASPRATRTPRPAPKKTETNGSSRRPKNARQKKRR